MATSNANHQGAKGHNSRIARRIKRRQQCQAAGAAAMQQEDLRVHLQAKKQQQSELGIKLKELIENSSKNRTTTNLINISESKCYDRLFDELIEVKQSVANMSSAMNKLYDHVAFTVNSIYSQDLTSKKTVSECGIQTDIYPMSSNLAHIDNQGTIFKNAVCEIGIQTDVNPVNEILTQNRVKEHIPSSFYELSTDLEGTKLDIVIMERKIASGVRENGQALDQTRAELADIRDDQQKAAHRDKAIIELLSKQNNVTKQEAKLTHLHQVGLEQLSNNSKSVNDVINNKGLSGKLNPDTNNKQNYDHPSTSQIITHKSVNGENRVTTPRPAPPEWLKCLPLFDTPYNESSNSPTNNSVTKHEAKLTHPHQDGLKQLSNNSKNVNDKGSSGKSNPDTVNNRQNYGHSPTSQKITHRSVNGENSVPTPRPAPPEWLKCLPLIDTPYNESSNNLVFRGIFGRRKTRWGSRREKYSDIVN
ncbi:Hypothetical predicted protein [Paramuricea clavata]|uniref:Uncharacterized protein n=1 Tax=Paramuricea clavata TaxID=317549 RepID=A0A7D9DA44_PARCT|nr:Hypothetical predicted protein [Paramuricea clavata]